MPSTPGEDPVEEARLREAEQARQAAAEQAFRIGEKASALPPPQKGGAPDAQYQLGDTSRALSSTPGEEDEIRRIQQETDEATERAAREAREREEREAEARRQQEIERQRQPEIDAEEARRLAREAEIDRERLDRERRERELQERLDEPEMKAANLEAAARRQAEIDEQNVERLDAERVRLETDIVRHEASVAAVQAELDAEAQEFAARAAKRADEFNEQGQKLLASLEEGVRNGDITAEDAQHALTGFNARLTEFNAEVEAEGRKLTATQQARISELQRDSGILQQRAQSFGYRGQRIAELSAGRQADIARRVTEFEKLEQRNLDTALALSRVEQREAETTSRAPDARAEIARINAEPGQGDAARLEKLERELEVIEQARNDVTPEQHRELVNSYNARAEKLAADIANPDRVPFLLPEASGQTDAADAARAASELTRQVAEIRAAAGKPRSADPLEVSRVLQEVEAARKSQGIEVVDVPAQKRAEADSIAFAVQRYEERRAHDAAVLLAESQAIQAAIAAGRMDAGALNRAVDAYNARVDAFNRQDAQQQAGLDARIKTFNSETDRHALRYQAPPPVAPVTVTDSGRSLFGRIADAITGRGKAEERIVPGPGVDLFGAAQAAGKGLAKADEASREIRFSVPRPIVGVRPGIPASGVVYSTRPFDNLAKATEAAEASMRAAAARGGTNVGERIGVEVFSVVAPRGAASSALMLIDGAQLAVVTTKAGVTTVKGVGRWVPEQGGLSQAGVDAARAERSALKIIEQTNASRTISVEGADEAAKLSGIIRQTAQRFEAPGRLQPAPLRYQVVAARANVETAARLAKTLSRNEDVSIVIAPNRASAAAAESVNAPFRSRGISTRVEMDISGPLSRPEMEAIAANLAKSGVARVDLTVTKMSTAQARQLTERLLAERLEAAKAAKVGPEALARIRESVPPPNTGATQTAEELAKLLRDEDIKTTAKVTEPAAKAPETVAVTGVDKPPEIIVRVEPPSPSRGGRGGVAVLAPARPVVGSGTAPLTSRRALVPVPVGLAAIGTPLPGAPPPGQRILPPRRPLPLPNEPLIKPRRRTGPAPVTPGRPVRPPAPLPQRPAFPIRLPFTRPGTRPQTPARPAPGIPGRPAPAPAVRSTPVQLPRLLPQPRTGPATRPSVSITPRTVTAPVTVQAPKVTTQIRTALITPVRVAQRTGTFIRRRGAVEESSTKSGERQNPAVAVHRQGVNEIRTDLRTGRHEYGRDLSPAVPNDPRTPPQKSLFIEKFSTSPPKVTRIDMGRVQAVIDPATARIRFEPKPKRFET